MILNIDGAIPWAGVPDCTARGKLNRVELHSAFSLSPSLSLRDCQCNMTSPAASSSYLHHSPTAAMPSQGWWKLTQLASCQVFSHNDEKCNETNSIFAGTTTYIQRAKPSLHLFLGVQISTFPSQKNLRLLENPFKRLAVAVIYQAGLALLMFT